MTKEEKREQLLKRILPALVITVIYFVFISGIVSDKANKAQVNYEGMKLKGISASVLPGMMKRQKRAQTEISSLKVEHEKFRKKLSGIAGYLTDKDPDIESMQTLSTILAENHLLIVEEKSVKHPREQLPPSVLEIKHWLQDSIDKETDSIDVEHLQLTGSFRDMHAAMLQIADGRLKALPVSLTMSERIDQNGSPSGELLWELILWM